MKLTNKQIKEIIKEELENTITESSLLQEEQDLKNKLETIVESLLDCHHDIKIQVGQSMQPVMNKFFKTIESLMDIQSEIGKTEEPAEDAFDWDL